MDSEERIREGLAAVMDGSAEAHSWHDENGSLQHLEFTQPGTSADEVRHMRTPSVDFANRYTKYTGVLLMSQAEALFDTVMSRAE